MSEIYIQGEPADNWDTLIENSGDKTYPVDTPGIDTRDGFDEYMEDTGGFWYEQRNGRRVYVRYSQLPNYNSKVGIQAVATIVQGAGGNVDSYTGSGFWTKLATSTVLNAVMRTMWLVIDANEVLPDIQSALSEALDDYKVVDSDEIPVYVDSTGKAYILEDAVEAVRAKLVELGAYSGGEPTVNPSDVSGLNHPGAYPNPMHFVDNVAGYVNYRPSQARTYTYTVTSSSAPIRGMQYVANNYLSGAVGVFMYSTAPFTLTRNDGATYPAGTIIVDNVTYYTYSSGPTTTSDWQNTLNPQAAYNNFVDLTATVANATDYDYTKLGLAAAGGSTVQGMTASDAIPLGFGDTSLPLDDVVPGWAARKKDVANPADDDVWAKSPALPLDLPLDDVWEDGYAGDSTGALDGDLDDILKDALVRVIPDILEDIIENTQVTESDVYDIPVDDYGNTPPAVPPVLDGSSNGLWTMYNPTKQQVNSFGAWLWSDSLIDQIVRQFNSPIDAVIGFHQIYCTPITGSDKIIKAGYLNSPVSAAEVTDQYVTIDCGEINVSEYYFNTLDYSNTRLMLYLPFIGIIPLSTSICMGSKLNIVYRIDVFTGTCLAQIKVIKENSNAVMYAFEGNCAVQIPLTATTYTGTVSALINGISAGLSIYMGDYMSAAGDVASAIKGGLTNQSGVKQSGTMGSNAGALGIRKPYLIATHPYSYNAYEYNKQYGFPINKTIVLSDVAGYTKVKSIHLSNIPCTDDELELIEQLLKEGVIVN